MHVKPIVKQELLEAIYKSNFAMLTVGVKVEGQLVAVYQPTKYTKSVTVIMIVETLSS